MDNQLIVSVLGIIMDKIIIQTLNAQTTDQLILLEILEITQFAMVSI